MRAIKGFHLWVTFVILFATLGTLAFSTYVVEFSVIVETIRPGGTCSSPTGTNDSTLFTANWKIASPLQYRINVGSIPTYLSQPAVAAAIDAAASSWNSAAAGLSYTLLVDGGSTTAKAGRFDGVNAINFGAAPFGAIAVAYIWASGGTLLEADMVLSTSGFSWAIGSETSSGDCGGAAKKMDVQDISTHEFGHFVGVAHSSSDSVYNHRTMFPFASYQELFKQSLAGGDVISLRARYGL